MQYVVAYGKASLWAINLPSSNSSTWQGPSRMLDFQVRVEVGHDKRGAQCRHSPNFHGLWPLDQGHSP
jgi:hypothetical protein